MLEVVSWLWRPHRIYRSQFTPTHVNVLKNMVMRNYPHPHRFNCITDQTEGFDPEIRLIPLWDDCAEMTSDFGSIAPSCYRRLKAFSSEMKELIGERFVSLDLDCIVCGDLSPLWNRGDEFVVWAATARQTPYNGSMWLMTAGSRAHVWDLFKSNPRRSVNLASRSGFFGTDQAWMNYALGPHEAHWDEHDGVYSFRQHILNGNKSLAQDARIVMFEGNHDPDHPEVQSSHPWVREFYH